MQDSRRSGPLDDFGVFAAYLAKRLPCAKLLALRRPYEHIGLLLSDHFACLLPLARASVTHHGCFRMDLWLFLQQIHIALEILKSYLIFTSVLSSRDATVEKPLFMSIWLVGIH